MRDVVVSGSGSLTRTALAVMAVALLALTACQDAAAPGSTGTAGTEETQVAVSMTEFAFEPASLTLAAGEAVRLVITNDGAVPHEFMVGRGVAETDDGAPHGYQEDFFDGLHPTVTPAATADGHDGHGFMMTLAPDETAEVAFTVPEDRAGRWEVGCFEPGHYEAGMRGALAVE